MKLRYAAPALTLALIIALGIVWARSELREAAFARNDAERLGPDPLGLRDAYETLKREGHRVALQPADRALPPDPDFAWWILQAGPDWFESQRPRELRRFLERGGTVVLMPEEAVTPIPGDDGEAEAAAMLDTFFAALGLDVRIVAFEPADPVEELSDVEHELAARAYTLTVSGDGEPFTRLATLETSWGNYVDGESLLQADIRLHTDGFPIIAEFHLGKGTLVLVAESTYFENEFIDRAENKSLLLALATQYGRGGIHFHPAH